MKLRKISMVVAVLLMISVISPAILPPQFTAVAQAATIKLNKASLNLVVGKTFTLRVDGTTKKASWTTSDKAVATVSSSGKVTAKKAGKATITATVNKKKYSCKVTVKGPVNPYLEKAPFKAQETTMAKIQAVIPEDWTNYIIKEQGNNIYSMLYPASADLEKGTSNITVVIQETGVDAPAYEDVKAGFGGTLSVEYLADMYKASGMEATISDLLFSDVETDIGTVFKAEYRVDYTADNVTTILYQTMYEIYINNYWIEVTLTNNGDASDSELLEIGEYFINSIHAVK